MLGMRLLPILFVLAGCQSPPPPTVVETPYVADSGDIAVLCGATVDGLADDVLERRLIIIRDGRIASVQAENMRPPDDLTFLDLSDYTCLPGLINTHVHLAGIAEDSSDYTIYYRRSRQETDDLTDNSALETLLTGFTTVRNIGDYFPLAIYDVRDRIAGGEVIGPRIQTAGPWLTIPGGGGDLVIPGHDESEIPAAVRTGVASGPDEFRDKARLAVAGGADLLKVIASGAVFAFGGVPGAPEMTQEEIAAVVEVAREAGIKVTAHVHSAQSGRDAILAGVDSLEHASLLDDETIALAAEYGVAFSMDVYNGTYTENVGRELGFPEEFMRKNYETTEAQRVVFEKAYALGIPILYGTDGSVLPHDMGGWQFEIMVERGMSPMDALKSATSLAAEHMEMSDDVGAIEVGRYGDLVAVRSNPIDDIGIMKTVDVVIKGGLIFKLN